MLNLNTTSHLMAEIRNRIDQLETLTVTVNISPELTNFLIEEFKEDGYPREGVTFVFDNADTTSKFFWKMVDIWPELLEMKIEYLAAWLTLTRIFDNFSVIDYLRAQKLELDASKFPPVEWTVKDKSGTILGTNNIYSYIGSDLVYCNPSRFVIGRPNTLFPATTPENGFNMIATHIENINPAWLLPVDSRLKTSPRGMWSPNRHSGSIFRTLNEEEGKLNMFGRTVTPNMKLSVFYSVADRILSVPVLSSMTANQNFDLMLEMLELRNPTIQIPLELTTKIYLASKYGVPKFSLLATL